MLEVCAFLLPHMRMCHHYRLNFAPSHVGRSSTAALYILYWFQWLLIGLVKVIRSASDLLSSQKPMRHGYDSFPLALRPNRMAPLWLVGGVEANLERW